MKRKPFDLQPFPTDPPELPTAAQLGDNTGTHRQRELRAHALELAINTYAPWPSDTTDFTAEHAAELNIQLADRYLAYINGDQP